MGVFGAVRRHWRAWSGGPDEDPRGALLRLKDIHRGRRAFIIGNGPSMRPEYFGLLRNEITFGFNGLCRLFDTEDRRPTYFMAHDQVVAESLGSDLTRHHEVQCIVGAGLRRHFSGHPKVVFYELPYGPPGDGLPQFREDLENGLQGGWTVAFCGLQMAWYMGIREVYLLGVDVAYDVHVDRVVGDYFAVKMVEGDFRKAYFDERLSPAAGDRTTMPNTEGMVRGLLSAKGHFERNGGVIYNAAPDSPLQLFPRSAIMAELGTSKIK